MSLEILTRYLASKDVYYTSRIALGPPSPTTPIDFDKVGYWSGRYPFDCKQVRDSYGIVAARPDPGAGASAAALTANVDAALDDYLLPVIKENAGSIFYLFIPPYSDAEMLLRAQHEPSQLQARLHFRHRLSELAASQPNVRFYDFQAIRSITDDLANYQDIYHYSAAINDWMVVYMHEHPGLPADMDYVDRSLALRYDQVFKACLH
jgi:hypothetical protein